jgi:hypothetical protein
MVSYANRRMEGYIPLFDPARGQTVIPPPGNGRGHWAGGCSALYDETRDRFYLCYRVRTPQARGRTCVVAESDDGMTFDTVWSGAKEQFNSQSIEKSSIFLTPEGKVRLYVSYVDARTYKWRIDLLEAQEAAGLQPETRIKILTADDCGNEGVKDPVIYFCGGIYHLFANYAPTPADGDPEKINRMHAEGNAFVSGVVNTGTGLATSTDGVRFRWEGSVLEPGTGWDAFMVRMVSILYTPPVFTAFYDGRPNVAASYEDRGGVAVSYDLQHFRKVSQDVPLLASPEGTGCLRYLSVVAAKGKLYYYYEYARANGAHELRLNVVDITPGVCTS